MSTASGKRAGGARPRHGGAAGDGPHRGGTTRAVGSEDEAAPSTGLCGCSGPSSQVLTPRSTHVYGVTQWMWCGPSHPTDPEAGAVTPENEQKGPHTRPRIHRAHMLTRPSLTRACSHTFTYTHRPTRSRTCLPSGAPPHSCSLTRAHLHTCKLSHSNTPTRRCHNYVFLLKVNITRFF